MGVKSDKIIIALVRPAHSSHADMKHYKSFHNHRVAEQDKRRRAAHMMLHEAARIRKKRIYTCEICGETACEKRCEDAKAS